MCSIVSEWSRSAETNNILVIHPGCRRVYKTSPCCARRRRIAMTGHICPLPFSEHCPLSPVFIYPLIRVEVYWFRVTVDWGHQNFKKGKCSPYSITERRVPELIPVLGSQPADDVSHSRGCNLEPGHTAPESSTITTRLPSHPQVGLGLLGLGIGAISGSG